MLTYLVGCGVLAVVGQIVLDRLRVVPHPQRWVLLVLPVLVALLWVMQTVADPRPARA